MQSVHPGRAASTRPGFVPRLCLHCHLTFQLGHFGVYLTVYNTVSLVSPFCRPTVTVT